MDRHQNGVTIRYPATANLLIDSIDRDEDAYPSSADFVINKKYSILNGFFHRLAVAEVVLDWCVDNVSAAAGNNKLVVIGAEDTIYTVTVPDGSYTVKALLDVLVTLLDAAVEGQTFSINQTTAGYVELESTDNFTVVETALASQLNLQIDVAALAFPVQCPAILPYTYVDFVSPELTYNQALKDATTNYQEQNVLYRWYFAWEGPAPVDEYNYPIYQGYEKFITRRVLPFPKQIRWENNIPVGQLSFQVYSSQGTLLKPTEAGNGELEWKITLLVSEN
jgi:hypothetical protein